MSATHHQHHVEECPSCGTVYKGKFCYTCGEKVFHPSDLGMKKFLSQTVDIFTHFDSKFIRSVKYLFYPGYLAKAYITGQRIKFAKPMQVFVLVNVLFYFVTHLIGVLDFSPGIGDEKFGGLSNFFILKWLEGFDNYIINGIQHLTDVKQQKLGLDNAKFSEAFYNSCWIYSKSLIILLIPVFALVCWSAFAKRFKYFGAAVVFAIYFVVYVMLAYCLTSLIIHNLHVNIYKPYDWLLFKSPLLPLSKILFQSTFEAENMLIWLPFLYFAIQRIQKGNILLTIVLCFLSCKLFNFLTFIAYKKLVITITLLLMHHG